MNDLGYPNRRPSGWYIWVRARAALPHLAAGAWINTIGPAVVGVWLTGDLWQWEVLLLLAWLTLPFNLLIYGVNDVFDQETDAKNPRKGTLKCARISPEEVRSI